MPFSPLKGYSDRVREKEKIVTPKMELTDEKAEELSRAVVTVKKGDMVEITYYEKDGYIKKTGMVYKIDLTFKKLTVIKTEISFDDIYEIKVVNA